jgi:hypothetical protein
MPNEIPDKVSLEVRRGESQVDFARRLFVEAARLAGLPLQEQVLFALSMIQSGEQLFVGKDQKLRLQWAKDPSPKDKDPLVSDKEWKEKQGKWHTHILFDSNKQELKRRQVYYVLEGGVLGSMKDIPSDSDVIIVDLNLIYQQDKYNATTAQADFGKYVTDAVQAYGQLEIKFNINSWTPGDADFVFEDGEVVKANLTKGSVSGFYDVIFGRRDNSNKRISYTTFTDQNTPIATYLYRTALDGGDVFVNRGLRTHALAHELGHAFGLLGSPDDSILGIKSDSIRNYFADWDVDKAIVRLLAGNVKKGVDWRRSGLIFPDVSGNTQYLTVFDILRAGARALARKV